MTTPAVLRARATTLREVARTIRTKAGDLREDLDNTVEAYPHSRDGVWYGTAATELYDSIETLQSDLDNLKTDVEGYAARCETEAAALEADADILQAQLDAENDAE